MKLSIPTLDAPNQQSDQQSGKAGGLQSGIRVVDLEGLRARLASLSDSRKPRGLRYELAALLLLLVLAKLAGEDQPSGIADWLAKRAGQLKVAFQLPWKRMPHHNTLRRIIEQVVKPEELDRVVSEHLRSLEGVGRSVLISIDGKTVRGTIKWNESRGEHLLAAYLPLEGIVLMQVSAGDKDNEITVAPELLRELDSAGKLKGKVVAGDAMHTQRALSVQILAAKADYLWFAKENQPTLRQDIAQLFEADLSTVIGGRVESDFRTFRTVEKGHGRIERRTITVSSELKGYSDWPGLEQVFKLERTRVDLLRGTEETEVVYGLTSLSRKRASAKRLLDLTRAYWGIENGLHGRRDVTFNEDSTRLTRGKAGRVMATLNNLVISLLRYAGYDNLARARRESEADLTLALGAMLAR
jgi:predicted transposase YbfD/YdcC